MLSHFNGTSYQIAFCLHHLRLLTVPLDLIIVCKPPNRGCTLLNTCGVAQMLSAIIILAGMAVFNVAGYLIAERRRWPVINASPRGQCSK